MATRPLQRPSCARIPLRGPGGRLRSALALATIALLPLLAGARPSSADDDLEPAPPWVFFAQPDEETSRRIKALVENSFADLNKVVVARKLLVRRFGAWSVPALKDELDRAQNDSGVLNATLTVIPLRARLGAAPELLPLVKPLVDAARHTEPWRRAAAFLALGALHGPDGLGRPRRYADKTLLTDPVLEARRVLEGEGLALLEAALQDPNPEVRVAACLALGKSGGAAARDRLVLGLPGREPAVEPRMAAYVALGLLPIGAEFDEARFVEGLADEETRVRAAAAWGAALQAACDTPPAWTQRPERLLRAFLASALHTGKQDTAAMIYARGCLAALHQQRADEWEPVFAAGVDPAVSREVAAAAAQVLLWCDERSLRARALSQLQTNVRALAEPVIASFLLRAGYDGTPEGVRLCKEWLGRATLTPRAERDWDVRWHAAIGLLRGLSEGRLVGAEVRKLAVAALDAAVEQGLHRDTPLLAPLEALLRGQRALLLAHPSHLVPEDDVRAIEARLSCRHGLLERDLKATTVARANDLMREDLLHLAGITGLKPGAEKDRQGSSKRFVERHLTAWPYFSRLDLLRDRGRRPAPQLLSDLPDKVLDR